jgi:hypothetical protein
MSRRRKRTPIPFEVARAQAAVPQRDGIERYRRVGRWRERAEDRKDDVLGFNAVRPLRVGNQVW